MRRMLILVALLSLLACDTDREYVYVPAAPETAYTVTLEIRECDGKLLVDFAGLEAASGLTLRASDATTRKVGRGEWVAVVTFGEAE